MQTTMGLRRQDIPALGFIGLVVAAGAAILGLSLLDIARSGSDTRPLGWAVALAILTVLMGRLSVRLPLANCIVSVSDALIFLTVLLFGADVATLTGALDGYAASKRARGGWDKRLFNSAGMALSVGVAARLYGRIVAARGGSATPGRLLLGVAILVAAQYLINTALVAVVVALREGVPAFTVLRDSLPWAGACYIASAVVAVAVFEASRRAGLLSALAIMPVPVLFHSVCRAALHKVAAQKLPSRG